MEIMSVKDASKKWNVSERRVQKLCEAGRIPGVARFGKSWAIPKDAGKPVDARLREANTHDTKNMHASDILKS